VGGRRRRSKPRGPPLRGHEPARLRLEHPVEHARPLDEEPLDFGPRHDEAANERGRHDVGHRRRLEHDGDLAEELSAAEPGKLAPGEPNGNLAVQDEEEAGPRQVLAQDPAALLEDLLVRRMSDVLELRLAQVREQAEA